jgi:hypothetical protein
MCTNYVCRTVGVSDAQGERDERQEQDATNCHTDSKVLVTDGISDSL